MLQLTRHFADKSHAAILAEEKRREWQARNKDTKARKEQQAREAKEESFMEMAFGEMAASQKRLQEFETRLKAYETRLDKYDARLDIYEESITRALLEQTVRLDALQAEQQLMLETAFVLDDGTRAFLSEDGSYAVREDGSRMGDAEFAEQIIPPGPNTAEDYSSLMDNVQEVQWEIDRLHRAQSAIDAARGQSAEAREKLENAHQRLNQGDLTNDELDALEVELEEAFPEDLIALPASAAKHLNDSDLSAAPSAKAGFANAVDFSLNEAPQLTKTQAPTAPEIGG